MKQQDIDAILASDPRITPSQNFSAIVMAAVWRESSLPQSLQFPWLRALPGLIALLAAVVAMLWNGVASINRPVEAALVEQQVQLWLQLAVDSGVLWLVPALFLSLLSVVVPMKMVRSRAHLA